MIRNGNSHPELRLKKLPFYEVLDTIIEPTIMIKCGTSRVHKNVFIFVLNAQQVAQIEANRVSNTKYNVQLQLRFCELNTTIEEGQDACERDDCFPNNLLANVNDKACQRVQAFPVEHANLLPRVGNTLKVIWRQNPTDGNFCLSMYLVKKIPIEHLLQGLMSKGAKPAESTRASIREHFTDGANRGIVTTMFNVSILCPLGRARMSQPCRASTCSHLQCFDAKFYLLMNERKPTWKCPFCNKTAIYENLVLEQYMQEVLDSPLVRPDDTDVQLLPDGSWTTLALALPTGPEIVHYNDDEFDYDDDYEDEDDEEDNRSPPAKRYKPFTEDGSGEPQA